MPIQLSYMSVPDVPGAINLTADQLTGYEIIEVGIVAPQAAQITINELAEFIAPGAGLSTKVNDNFAIEFAIGTYFGDSTGGAIVGTLPQFPVLNEEHLIKDYTGQASPTNPIGLAGNGILIDGQASISNFIQVAYGWGTVKFNGTTWSVVG